MKSDREDDSNASGWASGITWPIRALRRFGKSHPVLKFVLGVIVLMGLFYAIYLPEWEFDPVGKFLSWNLAKHARVSGTVLNLLGREVTVHGTNVSSDRFSMQVVRGCDALEPAALFLAAVFAFPARMRWKLAGAVVGALCIEITNVVRLVSLFFVGVFWRPYFETMHHEVWQAAFIVISVSFFALWALIVTRPVRVSSEVAHRDGSSVS
ncbi:MAG: archaeosortase/exosortase family protein [Planctomycetota bacterium]|mgnify:CR=1 FL=1